MGAAAGDFGFGILPVSNIFFKGFLETSSSFSDRV
jgi:hypothetical protein